MLFFSLINSASSFWETEKSVLSPDPSKHKLSFRKPVVGEFWIHSPAPTVGAAEKALLAVGWPCPWALRGISPGAWAPAPGKQPSTKQLVPNTAQVAEL